MIPRSSERTSATKRRGTRSALKSSSRVPKVSRLTSSSSTTERLLLCPRNRSSPLYPPTIRTQDHSVLVISLYEGSGDQFRAVPSAVQAIENNLSIANMDFEEFAGAVDSSGIFRGF